MYIACSYPSGPRGPLHKRSGLHVVAVSGPPHPNATYIALLYFGGIVSFLLLSKLLLHESIKSNHNFCLSLCTYFVKYQWHKIQERGSGEERPTVGEQMEYYTTQARAIGHSDV